MTPIKCIDAVLELLDKDESLRPYASEGTILATLYVKYPILKENQKQSMDTIRILKKLYKDGYVDYKQDKRMDDVGSGMSKSPKKYFITFEGALFSQQGGYKKKLFREDATSIFQSLSTVLVALGASVAAIYYARELIKNLPWAYLTLVNALLIFAAGAICGMTIWILMSASRKRKHIDKDGA